MRASRLVSILMLLQGRGQLSAQDLATELEVSVRTIYRDLDELGAAGVPVYAERGPAGGYRLVDGYRTSLTGLTQAEAESVFLAGLPGPASQLGLGLSLTKATDKLRAAMPQHMRAGADRIVERFHLDAPGWFNTYEQPEHLVTLAEAVWNQHVVLVRYQRWHGLVERRLEPLGIVLKGGAWYLVAQAEGQIRTYLAARMLEVQVLPGQFERPEGFHLAHFWRASTEEFESKMLRYEATVRASPRAVAMVNHLFSPVVVNAFNASLSAPDAEGWVEATIFLESINYATVELLRLGAEIEVLAPAELRAKMTAAAQALNSIYEGAAVTQQPELTST
jgi:predicted DNA-binding transcriptional regulator YafY